MLCKKKNKNINNENISNLKFSNNFLVEVNVVFFSSFQKNGKIDLKLNKGKKVLDLKNLRKKVYKNKSLVKKTENIKGLKIKTKKILDKVIELKDKKTINLEDFVNFIEKNKSKGYKFSEKKKFKRVRRNMKSILATKIKVSNGDFRLYDSIVYRRFKILRRVKKLNFDVYKKLVFKYPSLNWVKNFKLTKKLFKYRRVVSFMESQGLKRKKFRRRLSNYAIALQDKQKLKIFYVGLKEEQLKRIIREVFSSKNNQMSSFVSILESRLGSVLFRLGLVNTPLQLRQLVYSGFIKVNGIVIYDLNYRLFVGDVLKVDDLYKLNYIKNYKKRISLFFYPSKYLEVSFSLFSFLFYKIPTLKDIVFPFNINFVRILSFYNYLGLH